MKKNLLLFTFFISISCIGFSQNNVLKFSEKNFHLLKSVLEAQENGIKPDLNKELFEDNDIENKQLSANHIDDVELFSAIDPTNPNNLVVSWMETTLTTLSFVIQYSSDAGKTWTPSTIDWNHGTGVVVGGGDPVFAFNKNGKLYYSWLFLKSLDGSEVGDRELTMTLYWAYSDDAGKTWKRAGGGADKISEGVFYYSNGEISETRICCPPDKQWMAVDPISDDLFVSLTEFGDLKVLQNIWGVKKLKSGTTNFDKKVLVPADSTKAPTAGAVTVDKKGNVLTVFPSWPDTTKARQVIQYAYSSDGGVTYSKPVTISDVDVKYFSGSPVKNEAERVYNRINPMSYLAVDNSDSDYSGRIYVTWNGWDNKNLNGVDIFLSYSDDLGTTWSKPMRVNQDEEGEQKTQHRPSVFVNQNGVLIIGWYDGREAANGIETTVYCLGVSYDGGQTFTEVPVSTNTRFDMQEVNPFWLVGEYYQFTASDKYIYPFWAAKSFGDVEIFTAKIDIETLDVIDINSVINNTVVDEVYPNPASDQINLKINLKYDAPISGEIYNIEGKLMDKIAVAEYKAGSNVYTHSVNNLKPGSYYIVVRSESGQETKKFIKK